MRLFIAEKPELGRAIAEGLDGEYKSANGYIQKGNNIVTWAFGHILRLAEPHEYNENFKQWKMSDLPFAIDSFKYVPIDKSKEQLKIITGLINDSRIDAIVNCGDADDEGQILIDEIVNYSKTSKPVFRVLINDLTPKAVREEIYKIKPNSNFKGMSERGFARSQADWIVGINLTRAYTMIANKSGFEGILSVGRVQTPILGLIVARDKEFETFKSIDYFSLSGEFLVDNKNFKARLKVDEKITDENLAKEIKNSCENKNAHIRVKSENKKEYPPLPYNLLSLQTECAKLFGFTPDKTLQITQDLREKHKAITYNRSDCEYLPESMHTQAPQILVSIGENVKNDEIKTLISSADTNIKGKAFNDSNISAHYGIIPTQTKISKEFNNDELAIYNLIAKRFIIQFFNPREYQNISIEIEAYGGRIFTTSQNKTLKDGFRAFWNVVDDKKDDDMDYNTSDLSFLKNNSIAQCILVNFEKKQTKPRPYYTMATLLKDLNSVAKYVSDERIKKLLMEKDKDKKGESGGIGTPATRSNHIKTLIDRGYIEVSKDKKQTIKSSKQGRNLIALSPKFLSSPDMTALWYEQQKMIESSELSREEFLKSVTQEVVTEIKRIGSNDDFKILGNENSIQCPKCGNGVLVKRQAKNKKTYFWGCSEFHNGCVAIFSDNQGKPQLEAKPKNESPKNALACPKCSKGYLIERKSAKGFVWFGCSAWRSDGSGCDGKFKKDTSEKLVEISFGS